MQLLAHGARTKGTRVIRRLGFVAVSFLLAACTSASNPFGSSEPTPSEPPKIYSPYSGVEVDSDSAPVLVVKIENTRPARPHLGLNSADIVWVEQVEAGITRFAVLYSSRLPEVVGPIRSARITDIDLLHPFGAVAFAYSGAQTKLRPALADASFIDVSGDKGPQGYFRAEDRSAPHNFMGRTSELLERAGVDVARSSDIGWIFSAQAPQAGTPIVSMSAKWPANRMDFSWNAARSVWDVYSDGDQLPAAEGGTVAASTVIVQYVDYVPSIYKDKSGNVTPEALLIGSGPALVLRDGLSVQAQWARPTAADFTSFTDPAGQSIPFAPGTQWILLVDQDSPVELVRPTPSASPSGSTSSSPSP